MVDNYDSFTYNLVHLLAGARGGRRCPPKRRDRRRRGRAASRIGSSSPPAQGDPTGAGSSIELIRRLGSTTPVLGVCLGHQAVVEAFGGEIGQAQALLHGKASLVRHDGRGVFSRSRGHDRGRSLSLARRQPRAGRARGQRADRGRRGHGRAPSNASDRGRPVPSGKRSHVRRARGSSRTSYGGADAP